MDGTKLGPYVIDRELGSGGMGQVFAARTSREVAGLAPGTTVALKVVHPHLLETEGFFKRFLREADLGRSITHENVVRTLDCDQLVVEGQVRCFLVMEFVEGQTLAELLTDLERVPEELCRHVAREICKGLAAVHEAGVIHRDIKPENVLITPEQVVKLMDLGVARLADEQLRLSRTGAFVGSACYAAPEQFGGETDHRSDLHALGVLLYELSSGALPYGNDNFRNVMQRVCAEEPRRLGERNPQLSAFFEEVVHTLLAKEPGQRFDDAASLLSTLEAGEESAWWHERARQIQATTKRPIRRIRIPRETAVHGREDELAKLRELFDQAVAGEGNVVLLEGEAGIGKSRLVDELVARLQADGQDLNFLFGSYPPGGAATAAGGFSSAYREQFGEAGSAPYLSETPLLVPGFDAVLRGESAPADSLQLNSDSLATCFVHATRALAAERPTIVLIDDLHFAPDEARKLFTALAQAVPGHPILLVGTLRPGVPEDWLANLTRLDQVTRLELQRLGPKDLVALLQDSLGSTHAAEQLAGKIAVKSDGNPFFAFEILRGLKEGQFLKQSDDGTWMTTQIIDEIQIPSSVLDLVNARVADLTEDERDLLDVAACWGYEFDPTLVGEVVGLKRIAVLKTLSRIERKHRLVRSVGRRFQFDHHQVQEALYQSLPEMLREDYHAALAEALEEREGAGDTDPEELDGALCVDLCKHFLDGARGHYALRYLDAAQDHLTKGYLHAEVAALTERALAVPGLLGGVERVKALLRLAWSLGLLGRRGPEEQAIREAGRVAEEEGDAHLRVRARVALGTLLLRTSRYGEAEETCRVALAAAGELGDHVWEARSAGALGRVLLQRGRPEDALKELERQCALSQRVEDRLTEAFGLADLGHASLTLGRLQEAREYFERSGALGQAIGDRRVEVVAAGGLGHAYQLLGRFTEARKQFERYLAISRDTGDRAHESGASGALGSVLASLGHVREAQGFHERYLAMCRELGDRAGLAQAHCNVGVMYHRLGYWWKALHHYEQSCALGREIGNPHLESVGLVNVGTVWHALGDLVRARKALDDSMAICRDIDTKYPEGYCLIELGRLATQTGDADEARRLVEASLELRREIGHGDGVVDSLIALADLHLRAGGVEAAGEALDEALSLAREQGREASVVHALCLRARLPGETTDAALEALAAAEPSPALPECWYHLWKATRDRAHLDEAKRRLDEALALVPEEHHDAMLTNVRVNREIMEAWRAEFGEGGGTESVTRVGDA